MEDNIFNLKIASIGHFISRSGTLFLHSLLDNHPQILTIPGTLNLIDILKKKNLNAKSCFDLFEKSNPKFFDTSLFKEIDPNSSGLWALGKNKDDKIITDKELFKNYYFKSLENRKINPRNVIISIYYAYAKVQKKDLKSVKIILFHPHEKKTIILFHKFFSDSKYIIPVRDPCRAYSSIVKNLRRKTKLRNESYYPGGQLLESALDFKTFSNLKMKMHIVKIENLKNNLVSEMKSLSEYLEIDYSPTQLESTFGGLQYWGNNVEKFSNTFDAERHATKPNLKRVDLLILNEINREFSKTMDYEIIETNIIEKILMPFIMFLPMEDEINFLKNFSIKNFLVYLRFLIYFFPKRFVILLILIINKFSSHYKLIKNKN